MTTLGIGSGAAIAGLLGMNIKNYMEDWDHGFPVITSFALGISIIVCGYGLTRLKRIQKLTLYGRYPGVKRGENGLSPFAGQGGFGVEEMERLRFWRRLMRRLGWGRGLQEEDRGRIHWWKRMWKVRRRYH